MQCSAQVLPLLSVHYILELDVTNDESVETAVQAALQLENHIDVVINNAGVGHGIGAYSEAVPPEQFQRIFDVNVFGVQRVIRAILPAMRAQGKGLLVNVSSGMGRVVLPFAGSYTATKYALEGLSESYRYELSSTGVDVVIVEPGGFGTSFIANMEAPADTERLESYGSLLEIPQAILGGLGDILSSDNAPDPQLVVDAIVRLIYARLLTR